MSPRLKWALGLSAAAVLAACHVDQLLHTPTGPGTPSDSIPARITFLSEPTGATAGLPIVPPIQVAVLDSAGRRIGTYRGMVTLGLAANPGGGQLAGAATVAASNGTATFEGVSISSPGSGYVLAASTPGAAVANSSPFDVATAAAAPATHLAFLSPPQTAQAGDPISPAVQVAAEDSTGSVVPTYTGTITVALGANPGAGTLSGTGAVAATSGVATFSGLSIDKAGSGYTLVATASGLTGATSQSFDVTAPPPTTGSLQVTTATTGSNLDADGYTATVDGATSQAIGDDATVTFTSLSAGSHTVVLSGVASNCSVGGGASQTVTVPAGGSGTASFAVSCQAIPTTGSLTVSTATTGSDQDPDGYTVSVDGGASQAITDNGSVTFSNLSAGGHTVTLGGVASNCTVSGGASQTATVPAGGSSSASFAVTCQAPPPTTGSLTVTTSTTGSNLDPDGYTVSVDGGSPQSISDNGSVTYDNLSAGSHTVSLSGLASNCLAGSTSQTVSVPAGGSTSASFPVSCQGSPPPTNHPPVVNAGGSQSTLVAVLYQLNASFSDVDGNGPWTYQINWGDGSSSSGTLTAQGAIGPSHTYVLPGSYTITVTVTDNAGASGTDSKTLTVTV